MEQINQLIQRCTAASAEMITAEKYLVYDLLADSLALVELFNGLEQECGLVMTSQQLQALETVGDIYRLAQVQGK